MIFNIEDYMRGVGDVVPLHPRDLMALARDGDLTPRERQLLATIGYLICAFATAVPVVTIEDAPGVH